MRDELIGQTERVYLLQMSEHREKESRKRKLRHMTMITMTTITVTTITMMWCRYGTHSPSPRNLHERPTRTSLSKEKIAKKAKVNLRYCYSCLPALALQSPIDLLFAGSQNEGSDTGRHKDTAAAPPRRRPSASPSQSGVVGASSLTLCSPL